MKIYETQIVVEMVYQFGEIQKHLRKVHLISNDYGATYKYIIERDYDKITVMKEITETEFKTMKENWNLK